MANFGTLAAEIGLGVWGTPANFNGFRVLPSLRCLAVPWAGRLYIHFWGSWLLSALCQVQNLVYISLALSYIGSVTARHSSSSGRQPNCGAEQRARPIFDRAAITLDIGPHSSSSYGSRATATVLSSTETLHIFDVTENCFVV